ncbi:MAG: porin family protein [Bacteroides sp.]|nr:porin family protein [Bacteroidales bacterium]MBD5316225.1 porin family protein [Bacteroides sp.]MBD5377809.1 porin family protein [Bacteroides sp.]
MKYGKLCVCLLMALITAVTAGGVERGEKTLGLRGGYNTRNESGVAGVYFQYAFSRHVRLAPNVDYVFRNKGTDAYSCNINVHFPLYFGSSTRFDLYPLAGVNFISWNHRLNNSDGIDTSSRVSRLGLNAGAGAEYYCTPTLKLCVEAKCNFVEANTSGVFSIGIGYVF